MHWHHIHNNTPLHIRLPCVILRHCRWCAPVAELILAPKTAEEEIVQVDRLKESAGTGHDIPVVLTTLRAVAVATLRLCMR